jgi:hypothetical protein
MRSLGRPAAGWAVFADRFALNDRTVVASFPYR